MPFFSPSFRTVSASGSLALGSPVDFAYGLVVAVPISVAITPDLIDLQNPEWAISGVISILQNQLPAKLDALDTKHNDDIILRDVVKYYRAPLATFDALPAVVVVSTDTEYLDEYRNNELRSHNLRLEVYEESHEYLNDLLPQEVLAARLSRTVTGIHRVLVENEQLIVDAVARACHMLIEGIEYSDFVPVERGVFRGALMNLRVDFTTV